MHPDDVILARADCAWLDRGHLLTGSLSLSPRQVTFWTEPDGVLLRIPCFAIAASTVTTQGRLMVQHGGESLWFTGDPVAALGHRLAALRGEDEVPFEADEVVHLSGPSRRWLGPLPVWGVCTLTSRRLRFIARGLLAGLTRALGLQPDLDTPLPSDRLPISGPFARLIAAHLTAERPLGGWLARRGLRWTPLLLTDSELLVGARHIPLHDIDSVHAAGHTLTIHLSDTDLTLRLPHASGARRLIQATRSTDTGTDRVTGDDEMLLSWEHDPKPARVRPWSAQRQDDFLSQTRATRLWLPDGEILEMTPGLALSHEDNIGIGLPEHTPYPEPGTNIIVELGQPDGIHRFEARVLCVAPLPPHIQIPRRGRLLVLTPPEEVQYFNRRSAFRVSLRMQVNAWRLRVDPERQTWVPDGGRVAGDLVDLSESGCAIHTEDDIAIGSRMFLELRIDEHWIPLEGEVVRVDQGWPLNRHHLGVRFINVPDRLGKLLSQTVMAKQRSGG
jgi:hypothetical protein